MLSRAEVRELALLRGAKDLIDRDYAEPLDVPTMARRAGMSAAHFARRFKAAYGETPYGYLMTRRVERARALLRAGVSVTDACMAVGCTSLSSFSTAFRTMTGESPSAYAARGHDGLETLPPCLVRLLARPVRRRVEQDSTSRPPRGSLS